ncbi:MAG: hypothetical protein PWQ37_506 [Candidatus Petromonas sp.]|jgi:hypothetical protein|nr:hypothetical protein [Candidatus Petromonas sp.]
MSYRRGFFGDKDFILPLLLILCLCFFNDDDILGDFDELLPLLIILFCCCFNRY